MIDLQTAKTWLRVDDDAEDTLIQTLIEAADQYVRNSVPPHVMDEPTAQTQIQLLEMVLVGAWYERPDQMIMRTGTVPEAYQQTVRSLIIQLQNAYPEPEEEGS